MIIWNLTLNSQMKTTNCSSSDSCSDINVDNTEEHMEKKHFSQDQIDRKIFSYYYRNDQHIIILLKYTKQGNFMV